MNEPEKKKGFWDLFRTRSWAARGGKLEKRGPRRASDGDRVSRLRPNDRMESDSVARRRTHRPEPSSSNGNGKGKGREASDGWSYEPGPLTRWPPPGLSSKDELSLGQAMELISNGVPAFRGHKRAVPHASERYYALFATVAGTRDEETDAANLHDSMTQLMTLRLLGSGKPGKPWETLEQPSYAFCFGKRPGTITLNHWVSMSSSLPQSIALRDLGVAPREVELDQILERIKELERGLEEEDDDDDLMYKNLYRRFLRDPDRMFNPHKSLDKQITDLIIVLSRSDWIDFTKPRNQIVTRCIFDTDEDNHKTYIKFFHQLLLSIELDLRINSRRHLDEAKEKLLLQIPPTIQWSLALARRWRDYVRIDEYGKTGDEVRLRLKLKRRQVKMLKRFAQMMKWPNLSETLHVLRQRDADSTLDLISSHAMAFFSGLVLPGPTFPFLIMNSLIDIDPDPATDQLALLTHLHPSCGFQYRSSYTYWTASSIVGKVLAPTCRSVAGWVGPARPTVDLGRSQIARIRCRAPPRERLNPEDVSSMSERADPLGPPTQSFPVADYELPVSSGTGSGSGSDASRRARPRTAGYDATVRVELLALKPCPGSASSQATNAPRWFDAGVQFAIDGVSWPLRLDYDVSFVCAWPCAGGPHPLFIDYEYVIVGADELVEVAGWDGRSRPGGETGGVEGGNGAGGPSGKANGKGPATKVEDDEETVLVVEAYGVADNEVLARAWCAHWGLSAIVADVGRTCMACAIREAYAATLTVVILVDDEDSNRDG